MPFQFYPLNQTHRVWYGIYSADNGDVYVGTDGGNGIYIRPAGQSTFVELLDSGGQRYPGNIYGITGTPNGDIYRSRNAYPIQKRFAGVGDFVAYNCGGDTSSTYAMGYSPFSGKVFYTHYNGPGLTRFDPTHDPNHAHAEAPTNSSNKTLGVCVDKFDTVWIAQTTGNGPQSSLAGYLAYQTNETGAFTQLVQACPQHPDAINGSGYRQWSAIGCAKSGDIYASDNERVYRCAAGDTQFYDFQAIAFSSICGAIDGSVYATVAGGDIYKLDSPTSTVKHYAQIIG